VRRMMSYRVSMGVSATPRRWVLILILQRIT
jgi:hypothetical protein